MKLISNKALREFAASHADADGPLQDFRRLVEKGSYGNFADLRAAFNTVDKVGPLYVFNIGGNKYRLVAAVSFKVQALWVKAVLAHIEYDKYNRSLIETPSPVEAHFADAVSKTTQLAKAFRGRKK